MDKQTLARERQALATLIEVFDRKARQLGEPPFFQASKVLLSGVPSSFSATPPHIDPMLANELKILRSLMEKISRGYYVRTVSRMEKHARRRH